MKVSKLIYDNTKNSSDLFYRTSFKAPDPILFIEFRNKKYLILNDLEIERGKSEAKVDSVLPLSSISRKIKSNSIFYCYFNYIPPVQYFFRTNFIYYK